jgi:flagellin
MAFNDISLTSGMRSNLMSLQGTVDLLNRTQERLSTGKKVNSALDNPTSFFAAQGLNQRASDLASLKDGMGQAIQVIKAADAGITAITALIASAKGIAQAARASNDAAVRGTYLTQYNDVRTQIDNLAADSGYKGTDLLDSGDLTVTFNEDASSTLTVTGFDASTTGLAIAAAAGWTADAAGDTAIDAAIGLLDTAVTTLRSNAAGLSANLNVVTVRLDFTTGMVNTLTTGSDKLTLADMNEEGANMLMLQTRQALGTSALSMSAQAAQSVLKLFQ